MVNSIFKVESSIFAYWKIERCLLLNVDFLYNISFPVSLTDRTQIYNENMRHESSLSYLSYNILNFLWEGGGFSVLLVS